MPRYQRIPPRRPVPWRHTLSLWAGLAATLAVVVLAIAWSERLPTPQPSTAPATAFSAARAWPTLAYLADTVGRRLPGSPQSERARERLLAQLRSIPGLEVQEQDTVGIRADARGLVAYRTRNVIARLEGREPGSVLVSSHHDSPASSVGAADDGIAVAAMVEIARAMAAGPRPAHGVVFNFDDAEEQGLLGASAFLHHPWARDVRAFVDLESAGNVGKAVLFQAGPGNAWLARRYASSVPHPYGTVLGQDIFQSGLIPSGTDFEVYERAGLRGLDIAFYRGGWAYHTSLDRASAVAPGSMQHMGANALALTRALADGPLQGDVGGSPSVYYDLLGVRMLTYTRTTAAWLAAAAIALLLLAVRGALGARLTRGRTLRAALAVAAAGTVLAFVAALAGAALTAYVVKRPHGWFARPWLGVLAYGALALLPILVLHARLGQRAAARDEGPEERMWATWIASFLLCAVALALLTTAGIGSAYLLLWWVAGGAASLALLTWTGGRSWLAAAAMGLLPGTLLTLQTGYLAVELFAPIAGRFPAPLPFDFVIATITAVVVVLVAMPAAALLQRGGRPGAAAATTGCVALLALVTLWISFPFTEQRPQRLLLLHEGAPDGGRLSLRAGDILGPQRAASEAEARGGAPTLTGGANGALHYAADLPPVAPPLLELLGEERAESGGRVLHLQLQLGDAYTATVTLPDGRPGRWQLMDSERAPANTASATRMRFVAAPEGGWRFTLTVAGTDPLPIEVWSRRAGPTPEARALMDRLPEWSDVSAETVARSSVIH